ncbi:MAG TPA: SidA/IucD/PvdA family monooxygenase [Aldersonia sp.]
MANESAEDDIYDVVGVGFGPANLAFAIAVEEHNESRSPQERLRAVFVERQPDFGWHRGMLLDGTTMQVAFPKDLVTFRNPTSSYSFFAYLHDRGRLVDFVNHQTFFPTRLEFNDYLTWAAERLDTEVRYGRTVTRVDKAPPAGTATVLLDDGSRVRTRNVVAGVGLTERIPAWATRSPRCFHNHHFLYRIAELPEPKHNRFVVLGAGQSAAEIVAYLHRTYPHAEVHSVFARWGYSPADDSPFANRIFDPSTVDEFHRAPAGERDRLLRLHRGTNYSVVDVELIHELYAREYQERVRGDRRLYMRRASEVTSATETTDGIDVEVRSTLEDLTDTLRCDALVLCTGFEPAGIDALFGGLIPQGGERNVARDYRVRTFRDVSAGIYLQGGTEDTHGLSSSLLSNVAVRAGEILDSIVARRTVNGGVVAVEECGRRTNPTPLVSSEVR